MIEKDKIHTILDEKFIKVYDLEYEEGRHYLNASRRPLDDLVAAKDDDAVHGIDVDDLVEELKGFMEMM